MTIASLPCWCRVAALCVGLLVSTSLVRAQDATPPLRIGEATYEQAVATWSTGPTQVLQQGNLAVGAGSGADGRGHYAVREVQLVDVSGSNFEGLSLARYAFVDGTLYAVMARLHHISPENKAGSNQMTTAEVDEFERKLRAKYGPPTRSLKSMFADKKPNVFIWDLRDRELVLQVEPGIASSVQLRHKALAKKADAYTTAECDRHRPQCAR